MQQRTKQRRYSLLSRLLGAVACMALLVIALTWWLAGFSMLLGVAMVCALGGLTGPVVVEAGGGVIEFISALIELIAEVLSTILDAIGSIFTGFG